MNINLLTPFDIVYSIIIFFILIGISDNIKKKHIQSKPYYKYYTRGLLIKILGGVLFCLIYALYYQGGDTVNYFKGVKAMVEVFENNPIKYIELLFHENDSFTRNCYYEVKAFPPTYMLKDSRTYNVIKVSSIFGLFGLGGFLSTTIILSSFIYTWVWKLYEFMILRYPEYKWQINVSLLYLPSTVFWGSGIMKDTFAFGATCFAVYGLHQFFTQRKKLLKTVVQLFIAFYLIITIKAYIMFALLPGLLIFANFERLKAIKSSFVKVFLIPITLGLIFVIGDTLFFDFNELFGKYSADRLLEEAAVQNADLKRDVYGTNSFDIGSFDPTLQGALSKFLPATNAALFRPYLWESGSTTMLFSGIENLALILFSFWGILTRPVSLFISLKKDPFLIFCLLFSLILGFGVGLSTSNFGALVRYKIPFLPFFYFLTLYLSFGPKKRILPLEENRIINNNLKNLQS